MTTNARQGPLAAVGKRRWCLALLFAGVGALGFGCNPQTLGFLLMLTSDNKIDPVCKLADILMAVRDAVDSPGQSIKGRSAGDVIFHGANNRENLSLYGGAGR